jgi:hypothetical protein
MGLFNLSWATQGEKILPPIIRDRAFIAAGGDFKSGDAENMYIEFIVVSAVGHWKESPGLGVGIMKYLQGTDSVQVIEREIKKHLTKDIFANPLVDARAFPIIKVNRVVIEL